MSMPVIRILENGSIVENSSRKAKSNMFRIVAPAIGYDCPGNLVDGGRNLANSGVEKPVSATLVSRLIPAWPPRLALQILPCD